MVLPPLSRGTATQYGCHFGGNQIRHHFYPQRYRVQGRKTRRQQPWFRTRSGVRGFRRKTVIKQKIRVKRIFLCFFLLVFLFFKHNFCPVGFDGKFFTVTRTGLRFAIKGNFYRFAINFFPSSRFYLWFIHRSDQCCCAVFI